MDHAAEAEDGLAALDRDPVSEEDEAPSGEIVGGAQDESELFDLPAVLPVLPVRNVVVFPGVVIPLLIGREKSRLLTDAVIAGDKLLAICAQRHEDTEDPGIDDIYRVGTAARALKLFRMPDGTNSLLVHGLVRVGLEEIVETEPYWKARVNPRPDAVEMTLEMEAMMYSSRQLAEQVVEMSPNVPEEALEILKSIEGAGPLADYLSANLTLGLVQKQELLETFEVMDRLRKASATLTNQLEVLQLSHKITEDVKGRIDQQQREYYLHEQMRVIQKELGQDDPAAAEIKDLRERVDAVGMPEIVLKEARRELDRIERIPQASPERSVIRDYLDWLCELPWTAETKDNLDLEQAEKVLNEDHYGLDKVKKRIMEYLAVRKLKPDGKGAILCFAGPPGVGKTSLGQSIARALGRKFIRISLGGVRDEADIRGHRRTYIGAIPGRIIQELRKAGSRNPVLMLDELDKLGADFRGDPASALLEVLDPRQNHAFTDHYLSVPFDLSKILFIGTANYMDAVAPPLRDRMEVLDLPGYTTAEKLEIGKRYLLKRQRIENGLEKVKLDFSDDALRTIIESYTREAGVRNLERAIGTVMRGVAACVARNKPHPKRIGRDTLADYLGPIRFESDTALRTSEPGVATGLAYTPSGGELIFIEAMKMPGRGSFILTGQLGDVMRESAQAALSIVRARAAEWDIDHQQLAKLDIHIHVPAGGIPKDGPSAGVAMLTAIVSLLSDRPISSTVAMTGEITLRGIVLPIGGLKEKILAAHRAGIKTVILPARNERDLVDVPDQVRDELKIVLVKRVGEVLDAAIQDRKTSVPKKRRAKTSKRSGSKKKPAAPRKTARKSAVRKSARSAPKHGKKPVRRAARPAATAHSAGRIAAKRAKF